MDKIIEIKGMMCKNCVAHVQKALSALPGVTAEVELEGGTAHVTGADTADDVLKSAVTEAGYEVVSIR
jgi:Cu+-exporting ATPase